MRAQVFPEVVDVCVDIPALASFIASMQKENGEISCTAGGTTNPWNLVESAMGLSTAGWMKEAEKAFEWMKATQLGEGSWFASYREGVPEDTTRDTNVSSYIAVGVFHHFLITGDVSFLKYMWPTVKAGVDYAVSMQAPSGVIYWAKSGEGVVDRMALLTASSSVYMSIKCALTIAFHLGKKEERWERALGRLGDAIRHYPHLFNMVKSRYSMDWYYPVLCGAVTGEDARKRIDKYWDKFVVPGWGVRCVSDKPWTTVAETSELVLALAALEEYVEAARVFSWIQDKKYDDGSYWMGVTFPDAVVWPDEKTSWTAAAVLLAYDALTGYTPASRLFHHRFWDLSKYV